jgi:hypothetical protein
MKSVNLGSGVSQRLKQLAALALVIVVGIILSNVAERINRDSLKRGVIEAPARLP